MIPPTLVLLVLALASLRVWKLAADDAILAAPRSRLVGAHITTEGVWFDRPRLEKWLVCPWCAGFWVSLAVYLAWLAEPRATVYAAVPFAVSAAVGFAGSLLLD